MKKLIAASAVFGVLAFGGGIAVGDALVGTHDIKNNAVRSIDLKDGRGVGLPDLRRDFRSVIFQLEQARHAPSRDCGAFSGFSMTGLHEVQLADGSTVQAMLCTAD